MKYDINASDFMIREHTVCVFSNMNFGFKVVKKWHFSKLVTRLQLLVLSECIYKYFVRNYLITHL
jgi:hypothetical protein